MTKTLSILEKHQELFKKRNLNLIESTSSDFKHMIKDDLNAIVYIYEKKGMLGALAYKGRSLKPKWHYKFKSDENRYNFILKFFNDLKNELELKLKTKAERNSYKELFASQIELNSILKGIWGYDQTNIDFYQVTKRISRYKIEIRPISYTKLNETEKFDSCLVKPNINHFTGPAINKTIGLYGINTPLCNLTICNPNKSYSISWGR